MRNSVAYDQIDRIVDQVIDNAGVAARLKEALHSGILEERPNRPGPGRIRLAYDDTVDDPWDNVPI